MKRNLLLAVAIGLLSLNSISWADQANATSAQPFKDDMLGNSYREEAEAPTYISMVGDAIVLRPVLLATTIIGAGVYAISLPFTLLSHSTDQAKKLLIDEPAAATFKRCLGCSLDDDSNDSSNT